MVMARAARFPRRFSSRARSSSAARLVKVMAVSSAGLAFCSSTSQAARSTRVWVLPVPGPAITATVGSVAVTAAFCSPFSSPAGAADLARLPLADLDTWPLADLACRGASAPKRLTWPRNTSRSAGDSSWITP